MAAPLHYRTPNPPSGWSWHSRLVLLIAMLLLTLLGIWLYTGAVWPVVLVRLLTDGVVILLWLVGAAGIGLFILRLAKMWNAESPGALRFATAAGLGLGILSLAILGLGLVGLLNSIVAWAMIGLGWILGGISLVSIKRDLAKNFIRHWLMQPAGRSWLWLLATPFMALVLTAAMVPPLLLWTPQEPHGYDVVEYHLQIPREWYEAHRIIPLSHNVFSFFPFNVEMHYLLAMHLRGGPWAGMYVAQLMHLTFFVLTLAAVYGFARRFAKPAPATLAALALLTVPWLTQLSAIAYDEGGFLLFGILAIGWALAAAFDPVDRLKCFALAGLMAGFAAGSKLTAVPEVLLAVPLVLAIAGSLGFMFLKIFGAAPPRAGQIDDPSAMPKNEPSARPGRHGPAPISSTSSVSRQGITIPCMELPTQKFWLGIIVFSVAGLLSFSPWLIRNIAWAHNPVFPELMPLLGKGDFDAVQVERFEKAHKPPPAQQAFTQRLKAFGREVLGIWPAEKDGESSAWQFGYLILPLALVAFGLSIRRPQAWCLFGLLLILTLFWLLMTHLQSRFFILAAPIAALLIAGIDWRRGTIVGVLLIAIFAAVGWTQINSRLCDKLYGSGKAGPAIVSVLGMDGVSLYEQFMPPDLPTAGTIILVGDAKAFIYPIPMSRLRYRTVFDVKSDRPDIVQAWIGNQPPASGDTLLIDPAELKRFHQTYFGLPPIPPEIERRNSPYVARVARP